MPPQQIRMTGRDDIATFFATVPADGHLDLVELVTTRANGQPALAACLSEPTGDCRGYGITVFTLAGDQIATIAGSPTRPCSPPSGCPPPADGPRSAPARDRRSGGERFLSAVAEVCIVVTAAC